MHEGEIKVKKIFYFLIVSLLLVSALCSCQAPKPEEECDHRPGYPATQENVVEPTYKSEGSYDEVEYCILCGEELSRTQKTIDKLPCQSHESGEPVREIITEPTYYEDGKYEDKYFCKYCDEYLYSDSYSIPMLECEEHTPGEPLEENVVPSTYFEKGSYDEVIYCTTCGDLISKTKKEIDLIVDESSLSFEFEPGYDSAGNVSYYVLKRYIGTDTEVVIPATFNEIKVTSIGQSAFNGTDITGVTIPNSITGIGESAFENCSSLAEIEIPEGVRSINKRTFYNCTSLQKIVIPVSVSNIYNEAFYECSGYDLYISDIAAWCKISIRGIYANDGTNPFGGSKAVYLDGELLTDLVIPEGVTQINGWAFQGLYDKVKSITLPKSLKSVGQYAFSQCYFESVYISDLYSWCNISFDSSPLAGYKSTSYGVEGVHNLYLNGKLLTDLVIPDGITRIPALAFYGCTSIARITVPYSVTYIEKDAFSSCRRLIEIYNISDVDINIWDEYDAAVLNQYTFTEGKSKIWTDSDGYVFYEDGETCYLVAYNGTKTELTLPESCNGKNYEIYKYAFTGCNNITSVIIPEGVTNIGYYAFADCDSLAAVTVSKSVTAIGDYAFAWCSALESVIFADDGSLASIGSRAFYCCASLESISIPASVNSIGETTFGECTSLVSATFAQNSQLTTLPGNMFYGCSSMVSVTLPASITSIGFQVFSRCTSLTDVYYYGTEEEWAKISTNNNFFNETIHFNYVPEN